MVESHGPKIVRERQGPKFVGEMQPLQEGEVMLFKSEKAEVRRDESGGLVVIFEFNPDLKAYVGADNETFTQIDDVRVISLGGFVVYQEASGPPVFITPNAAYTPNEIVKNYLESQG